MDENPYDYFVGKAVTVVTIGTSLRFTPDNHLNYFVGILRSVDEWTCTLVHPVTGSRSLYRLEHVVAMHEEQQVDPENADDLKMLQDQEKRLAEFKKNNPNLFQKESGPAQEPTVRTPPSPPTSIPPVKIKSQETPFVDLDQLKSLAKLRSQKQ